MRRPPHCIAGTLLFVLSLTLAAGCIGTGKNLEDEDPVKMDLDQHVVHKLSFWEDWDQLPIERRITLAPPEVIDFIRLDNIRNGIKERPKKPAMNGALLLDLGRALNGLPACMKNKLAAKVVAIILVQDLGGTGYTDVVWDKNKKEKAAFVLLDVKAIDRKANEWITWKENSPFKAEKNISLKATIENDAEDNRVQTFQYMLLHEGAHAISIGENFHPSWNQAPTGLTSPARYPFFNLSWEMDKGAGGYVMHRNLDFAERAAIVYYFGPKLSAIQATQVYLTLQKRPFVSLYALTNPADDFAESLAFYVHKEIQKKPWRIEIKSGTSQTFVYEPSWSEPRLARKKALLASFLAH